MFIAIWKVIWNYLTLYVENVTALNKKYFKTDISIQKSIKIKSEMASLEAWRQPRITPNKRFSHAN